MKVGLKPKRFFHDIVPVPKQEMEKYKEELSKRRRAKTETRRPYLLDAVRNDSKLKKRVSQIWGSDKRTQIKNSNIFLETKRQNSLETAAEEVLKRSLYQDKKHTRGKKFKILFKDFLLVTSKVAIIALIIYNALSLYYQKEGIKERLYNLALASKIRFATAAESLSSFDREKSRNEIEKAGLALLEIKEELFSKGVYNFVLTDYSLLNDELKTGQNILELGIILKESNDEVNQLIDALIVGKSEGSLSERIDYAEEKVLSLKKKINRTEVLVTGNEEIKKYLGKENTENIQTLISKSKTEIDKANKILRVAPLIIGQKNNRYLILFTNNAELRPVGGFPGNYGLVSFKDGNYEGLYINDIYYLDWQAKNNIQRIEELTIKEGSEPEKVIGLPQEFYHPEPIEKIKKSMDENRYWRIPYVNWSVDFKTNAKRAQYFYNYLYQQGDASGLIFMTPNIIEDLLGVVGPVKMEAYGVELSKENFREIIEFKVEFDNEFKRGNKKINPKQILADFGPLLLEKISEVGLPQKVEIFEAFLKNLNQKEILLYHQKEEVQKVISELGFDAKLKDTGGDFLGIISTNINAMKNGRDLQSSVYFKSAVDELGFAQNELRIIFANNNNIPRNLHDHERSYIEIIVPEGSRLREAKIEGVEYDSVDRFKEAEKTIFGFVLDLQPGEAKNVLLKYQVPLKEYKEKGYSLYLYKQPGATEVEFKGEIVIDEMGDGVKNYLLKEIINRDIEINL